MLTDYIQGGIGIFAITCLYLVMKQVMVLVGNHISHNTDALSELSGVIRELKQFLMHK